MTYREVETIVRQVGTAMIEFMLAPEIEHISGHKLRIVAISCRNRKEWLYVELACVMYNFVAIAMYL